MNCQVCGHSSGKFPLCKACNAKKEQGQIIKCPKCNKWHYADSECSEVNILKDDYLYNLKARILTESEQSYFNAIKEVLSDNYYIYPQQNLTVFIDKTNNSKYRTELFRMVDFLITDKEFAPKIVIEIQDQTHLNQERKERDTRIKKICEEAGIPIIKLWTSYGINNDYIKNKIEETLNKLPVDRIHHFSDQNDDGDIKEENTESTPQNYKNYRKYNNYKKYNNYYKSNKPKDSRKKKKKGIMGFIHNIFKR